MFLESESERADTLDLKAQWGEGEGEWEGEGSRVLHRHLINLTKGVVVEAPSHSGLNRVLNTARIGAEIRHEPEFRQECEDVQRSERIPKGSRFNELCDGFFLAHVKARSAPINGATVILLSRLSRVRTCSVTRYHQLLLLHLLGKLFLAHDAVSPRP